jgi:alkanesulfonate monooxygenase SsuD/methylene tetrahydromethanopterin reductase-like flavin-dependent oxidoreductase (luciferase family)
MRPVRIHAGSWRHPGAFPGANFDVAPLARFARTLEQGCFDAFFMADHRAVPDMPPEAWKRSRTVISFDPLTPLTPLTPLAEATERLGLVATASTTIEQPRILARRFASLDHLRPPARRPRRLERGRHHIQGRMDALGRPRERPEVLPGASVVVGATDEAAQARRARLDGLRCSGAASSGAPPRAAPCASAGGLPRPGNRFFPAAAGGAAA